MNRFASALALATVLLAASCSPASGPDDWRVEPLEVPAGVEARHPAVAAAGAGAWAAWTEPGAGGAHALRLARWDDGAWSAPVTAAEGRDWFVNWADFPRLHAEGDTLIAHVLRSHGGQPYAYDIYVTRSVNGGASWSEPARLHDDTTAAEHGFVSYARDARGGALAAWLDGRSVPAGGAMTLRAAHVATDGSIDGARELDERVCDCCPTDAVAVPGGALVAYRDRTEDEYRDVRVVRLDAGGAAERVFSSEDGWQIAGCPVNGPALAAQGADVLLAWFTAAADEPRVYAALSNDAGRTFGRPVLLARGDVVGRVDAAFVAGAPWVTWLASGDEPGVFVHDVRRAGDAAPRRVAEANAGRETGAPRLAGLDDGALVLWTAPGGGLRGVRITP